VNVTIGDIVAGFGDNVAVFGDIVAGVDGTLGFAAVLFSVNFKNPTSNLRDYQEERHKSYTTC